MKTALVGLALFCPYRGLEAGNCHNKVGNRLEGTLMLKSSPERIEL